MAIDVTDNVNVLNQELLGHVQVDVYNRFIMPAGEEISTGDLSQAIDYYQNKILPKYQRNLNYYNGHHKIIDDPKKAPYKPDNRIVINFPRKVVNDSNGFFIGHQPTITDSNNNINQEITQWCNLSNFNDVANEVSKQSLLYGHSYFYIYQDANAQCNITSASPLETFLIYDNTAAMNPMYAVQFSKDFNDQLNVTLTDAKVQRLLVDSPDENQYLTVTKATANPYPIIPIIEAKENDECTSILNDLFSVFDEIDRAMSQKSNDVDYFADAYLKLVNVNADKDVINGIQDNRVITANGNPSRGNPDIGFLPKPSADETQENLINRLINSIYEIANVVNINDSAFSGNPSGVALKMKFQPMQNIAATKSLKFSTAFRQVFQCVLSTMSAVSDDEWQNLSFKFHQNIPMNLLEWVQMYGKISNYTWWSQIDGIDPDVEQERMTKQMKQNIQAMQMNPLNTDTNAVNSDDDTSLNEDRDVK